MYLSQSKLLWATVATFFLLLAAHAEMPAFPLGSVSQDQPPSFTGTRGWVLNYTPPNSSISITELGVFDNGGDGLVNPHQVGLWLPDGTLLASATVPAGTSATFLDGYRYVSISPLVFPARQLGIIAAQYSAGDADDLGMPIPGG